MNKIAKYKTPTKAEIIALQEREEIFKKANRWLLNGKTGSSSRALLSHYLHYFDESIETSNDYPYDLADLERCWQLVQAVEPIEDFLLLEDVMVEVSPQWACICSRWTKFDTYFKKYKGDKANTDQLQHYFRGLLDACTGVSYYYETGSIAK